LNNEQRVTLSGHQLPPNSDEEGLWQKVQPEQ
jgi:hypothetical protein